MVAGMVESQQTEDRLTDQLPEGAAGLEEDVSDSLTPLAGPIELDPTGQTLLDTGGYLTLREAALAVDKSEQTIRRLVKAGKVISRKVRTRTGFVYLVEPRSLKESFAQERSEDVEDAPPPGEAVGFPVEPTGFDLSDFYRGEVERLREELHRERTRCEERTQELIAARTQAGRWEGMSQGFERFNQQLVQRLQLLEHNPRPSEVIPSEGRLIEREAPSAPKAGSWLVWLVALAGLLILGSQVLAVLHRGL